MGLRSGLVGFVVLGLVAAACGDTNSSGDDGNEAGAGNGGEAGTSGANSTGGNSTGGRGGTAGASGDSGAAGEGGEPTGGTGAEGGSDAGGMGGEPSPGGGMAGGGMTGAGAGGVMAGGGMAGGGMAGGGMAGGGMAGGGMAGGGMAGGGMAGGGMAGGGMAGGGMAGGGTGGSETNCSDGQDNDGDLSSDCADSDCALVCSLGTCPAGTSPAVYTATGLPLAIPDNMPTAPAFVPIAITTPGLVGKIAVETSITHTWDADLHVQLVTPYGVRQLATEAGFSGDNFTRTVFSDGAANPIATGVAPFTGAFRPQQDLAAVNGVALAGTYGLRVGDDSPLDAGQITSFSLAFCQCLATSGSCEFGPYACENGVDDDGDGLVDCAESACASSPSCPQVEHACGDGVDNDVNGSTDCADPACSWACTALGPACTGTNRVFTYSTRSVPQTIGTATGSFPAPIYATASGTVVNSAVRFNVTHTFAGNLTLYVTSPSGIMRGLTGQNGGDGDNYTNTVFIDSATTPIVGATAPFTGSYQPQEIMSFWNSQSARGYWYGELSDWAENDGGTFTELSLGLCVAP